MTETVDPIGEFTTLLTAFARSQWPGQACAAPLRRAIERGWKPAQIAENCSRKLPRDRTAGRVIQARIEWYADHQPAPAAEPRATRKEPVVKPKRPAPCGHTDDPNGWLMDLETGSITGKCPCWDGLR